jgi:hypothetical protein
LCLAPPEETEGDSEEEKLKQKTREKSRKEFLSSVSSEGKYGYVQPDKNNWLGKRKRKKS